VDVDKAEAFRYHKMTSDIGYADAQLNIGYCYDGYDNGDGVDVDKTEAFRYFKTSANQGNVDARCRVGLF
jgi:hypothetical protein